MDRLGQDILLMVRQHICQHESSGRFNLASYSECYGALHHGYIQYPIMAANYSERGTSHHIPEKFYKYFGALQLYSFHINQIKCFGEMNRS